MTGKSTHLPPDSPLDALGPEAHEGLRLLLKAYDQAHSVKHDAWEFAVPIPDLKKSGLTDPDLRWLVYKRHLVCIENSIQRRTDPRIDEPEGRLHFTKESCFALTETGTAYARTATDEDPGQRQMSTGHASLPDQATPAAPIPHWDKQRRELFLGHLLVKRFKRLAKNQEAILDAFQEEEWPARIDSPLVPGPEQDPRQQLHDAIVRLNRHQENPLLRFRSDGSGEGILWDPVQPPSPQRHP